MPEKRYWVIFYDASKKYDSPSEIQKNGLQIQEKNIFHFYFGSISNMAAIFASDLLTNYGVKLLNLCSLI